MSETGEGQPAPLNPQARADVDKALKNAGVEGKLNPKATEDIDRTLNKAGADNLKGPATLPSKDNLPYMMQVTDEEYISKDYDYFSSFYKSRTTPPNERPEIATVTPNAGVSVNKFKYEGSGVRGPEDRGFRSNAMNYEGFTVEAPDVRLAVVKGALSGATFVIEFDKEGNVIKESTFHGNLEEILSKAADTYPPNELLHLVMSANGLSLAEREQVTQRIKAVGGRDKYVLQEAERLVKEGQFANMTDARRAVVRQIEIAPSSPQAEKLIVEAVDAGEIPQDITDPGAVGNIIDDLHDFATNPNLVERFPRKFPELMRVSTITPKEKARFAYSCAQAITKTLLGKNNAGNVSFENSQQLSQIELDASGLGGNKAVGIIEVLNYTWNKVVKLQQKAGLPTGRPRFRII